MPRSKWRPVHVFLNNLSDLFGESKVYYYTLMADFLKLTTLTVISLETGFVLLISLQG